MKFIFIIFIFTLSPFLGKAQVFSEKNKFLLDKLIVTIINRYGYHLTSLTTENERDCFGHSTINGTLENFENAWVEVWDDLDSKMSAAKRYFEKLSLENKKFKFEYATISISEPYFSESNHSEYLLGNAKSLRTIFEVIDEKNQFVRQDTLFFYFKIPIILEKNKILVRENAYTKIIKISNLDEEIERKVFAKNISVIFIPQKKLKTKVKYKFD